MERLRILFLAADPGSMGQVNAGREAREIRERLRAAEHRDAIDLIERFSIRPGDLQRTFFEVRPHVVHFCGHGTPEEALVFVGDDGGAEPLGKHALADVVRVHKETIRVVVLSACHSRPQVEAIAEHVECAIGMRRAVGSLAAAEFSAAFYLAVGFGASVAMAFESAIAELRARGIPEDRTPQLVVRPGTDATRVILLGSTAAPSEAPIPPAPPQVSIARLPATGRELFGREKELAWLDACWSDGVRVASIVAFGGVGKSALVNAWLARMDRDGWRGAERVYGWSFYSQGTDRLTSSDEFVATTLRELRDPDPAQGSPWDKGERLAKLVRKDRTILVLDGLEPLQWGPGAEPGKLKDPALQALVKELGAQNKGLCIITTRIAVADLEGLAGRHKVEAHDLDHLSPEAGADLLAARGAKGTDAELQEAAREYHGHGLALTLLGTYVRKAHKGDIRKRDLIPPLAGKPAHRMMATYERWFADKPELALLRMLGLFDRPAPEDEIAALRAEPPVAGLTDRLVGMTSGAWNEAVTTLRDVGLLAVGTEGEDRLDAHPLVREYFGDQLRREQQEAWREGHRRLYEHLEGKAKRLPGTVEEMAPLYAAVVHECLAGKHQEALDDVWWKRIRRRDELFSTRRLGAYGSDLAVLSAFFDPPWDRLAPGVGEVGRALLLNEVGVALRALGRPEATALLERGWHAHVGLGDHHNAAFAAANLGEAMTDSGELERALAYAAQSVKHADECHDHDQRMATRASLAVVLHALGRRREAGNLFEEAEGILARGYPLPTLRGGYGFWYCDLLLDQGRSDDVLARTGPIPTWAADFFSRLGVALEQLARGRAHHLLVRQGSGDHLLEAEACLTQAVVALRDAAREDKVPLGLLARAALRTHTGAFADARRDLDEALALATRCGFRLHEADARLGLARLALAEGNPAPARENLAAARRIIDDTGYHRRDAELAELDAACR